MTAPRNTLPRNIVVRPKENIGRLSDDDMQELLKKISELSSEDLLQVMTSVSVGLIKQRDIASRRAIDMETVAANMVKDKTPTPATCAFVLKEFVLPHESALRTGDFLIEKLERRARQHKKSTSKGDQDE